MSFRGGNRGNWRGAAAGGRGGARSGAPPPKKFRGEDEDEDDGPQGTFEERLAGMLEDEDELYATQEPSTAMEEDVETDEDRFLRWRRPEPPKLNEKEDTLIFQQVDIDHYICKPYPGMPGVKTGVVPVMRMFGVTKAVCLLLIPHFNYLATQALFFKSCRATRFAAMCTDFIPTFLCLPRRNSPRTTSGIFELA